MNINFKLFTGETINYSKKITFGEKALNHNIQYKTLEIDFTNLIKAIKSIKYNGVRQVTVNTKDNVIDLIIDYCFIKKTLNNEYYLLLTFDDVDEQLCDLCYRLNDSEVKEYEALEQEQKDCYCLRLLNEEVLN